MSYIVADYIIKSDVSKLVYDHKTGLKEVCEFLFRLNLLLVWKHEFSPSRKLHKDGDWNNDDEVKDGEFVHLLAHTRLPALPTR